MSQKNTPPQNFAHGQGYKVPAFARPLLSLLPSYHLKDQPPAVEILAGPYRADEYHSALKAIQEYSRAGRALAMVYTRTQISIAQDTSRELLAVEAPQFPSSPVQSAILPGKSLSFQLAPYLVPLLPDHHAFLDLLGSGAGLLILKPRTMTEIYNDQRSEISNLFHVLRRHGSALAQLLALTPYQSGKTRHAASSDHHDPLERARRTILRLGEIQNREDWRSYQNALPGIVDRLRDIEITDRSPDSLLLTHDRAGHHFHLYLEPGRSLPNLAQLTRATVSILAAEPIALPYQTETHKLPVEGYVLTIGYADRPNLKRTKETRLPRKIVTSETSPTPKKTARNFPARSEAAEIRQALDLSQQSFADLLGIPLGTLRKWEAGGTVPAPGKTLLSIAARHPQILKTL